jgi:hypothetical protein
MRLRFFACMLLTTPLMADPALDEALDAVASGVKKWGVVCEVARDASGKREFRWHDYRGTSSRTDFWPASTIKLYTAIAACELLHAQQVSLDALVGFEHQNQAREWITDSARTPREMISEVFRRSSNEDYTLLLRLCGIDSINTTFLTPERGFPSSALMRGYVKERPWCYVREEPQRLTLVKKDTIHTLTHHWQGRSYSAERGASVIDAKTGNVTSPRELCEALRRVMFHEELPHAERFRISDEQARFLREGSAGGFCGLETRNVESGPTGWIGSGELIFPKARFYHKSGLISNFALELACLDDSSQGGPCVLFCLAVEAGHATKPQDGESCMREMCLALYRWLQQRIN